jgi:hypothetical protein
LRDRSAAQCDRFLHGSRGDAVGCGHLFHGPPACEQFQGMPDPDPRVLEGRLTPADAGSTDNVLPQRVVLVNVAADRLGNQPIP